MAELLSELEQSVAEGSTARQELHGTKAGKPRRARNLVQDRNLSKYFRNSTAAYSSMRNIFFTANIFESDP